MEKCREIIKKYPCVTVIMVIALLVMTARAEGDIATLFERTLVSFISGIAIISCILYSLLYLTGSLNPGDKVFINFKKLGEKLLKGSA